MKGKRVLVIGLGLSGRSAVQLLLDQGAQVHGVDRNQELLYTNDSLMKLRYRGLTTQLDGAPLNINEYGLVVVSPGINQDHPYYVAAKKAGIEIVGEIELACRYVRNPMIGITGTNGKTTVTLLTAHVLNQCGKPAKALGNVGIPLAAELANLECTSTILVAELSSFQLDTLYTKVLDAGVILNITPDHLDRYGTMAEYAKSKIHMKDCLKPNAKLFVDEKTWKEWRVLFDQFPADTYGFHSHCTLFTDQQTVFFKEKIDYIWPPVYRGRCDHDIENLMAAYALCREMGVTGEQFITAAQTFKKPSHRIEFVENVDGVAYYDDSKGTNLDAVMRAVDSLQGSIVLIAGGVDKGAPYTPWIDAFGGKVKYICAIGQAAEKIKKDLQPNIAVELFSSLEAAVKKASELANPGENVLLSPGCSSFDMFRDYAHRGDEFKRIVQEIKKED